MASSEPPPPIVTRAAVKVIAESVGIAQATSPGRDTVVREPPNAAR